VVPREKAPQCSITEVKASPGKLSTQFLDGYVASCREDSQDQARMRFDCGTAPITAQRPRPQVTRLPLQRPPAADAGSADLEARRRNAMAQSLVSHSSNNALSQIK
jgi:hypothetical protein